MTGASGFLGGALTRNLGDGVECHTVSRSPQAAALGVACHGGDVLSPSSMQTVLERVQPDVLVHLAWMPQVPGYYHDVDANEAWASASLELARLARSAGVQRVVLAGSCVEFGRTSGVLSESALPAPDTAYGRAKLRVTDGAFDLMDETFAVSIPRIFFAYGRDEAPNRLVPAVIRSLLDGESIDLSAGTQIRDYCHADDIARAIVAMIDHELDGVVHVGSGRRMSIRDVATAIGDRIGRADLLNFGARPGGADSAEEWTADTTRLRQLTDWTPTFDLESGIDDVVTHWASRREDEVNLAR